jgi:putative transposase
MPSSHVSSNFHLVFSTKERSSLITIEWRERLHAYLAGIVKGMDAMPLAVGGVADHIHLLVSLKSKHRLDYVLRDLKADSSNWIHTELRKKFEWQKGYGAFSVSPTNVEGVKKYIANQEKHHEKKNFQVEYVDRLNASGIEFEEKYLW